MIQSKYRPTKLSDIVGQPLTRILKAFVAQPSSRCFLLEGAPGVGKSATAYALASELGADDPSWGGGYLKTMPASELTIDNCREMFDGPLRYRYAKWKVLIIEELDGLSSKQVERYLKVALERLCERTLIIATSNGAARLDAALLERFRLFSYSSGPSFRAACQDRLAEIWTAETGEQTPPAGYLSWGVKADGFSMRLALECLDDSLMMEAV